jgi:cell division protein FtsZ
MEKGMKGKRVKKKEVSDMKFEMEDELSKNVANIKVIGVGGAGNNAVNRMIDIGIRGVEYISVNTDSQDLLSALAPIRLQIGRQLTSGLGAGADPEVGRKAALESQEELSAAIAGAHMVFITAGRGGGTGTGSAPVFAELARKQGSITVAVVTRPFNFEGRTRKEQAEIGYQALKDVVDTVITVPNERLLQVVNRQTSLVEAFKFADDILRQAVQSIAELITVPGIINLDFADIKTVMVEMGGALMGTGTGTGEQRALKAVRQAISSPLLEDINIGGARGLLINITGGKTLTLHEASEASNAVFEVAGKEANVIFGTVIDDSLNDEVKITVIATGFDCCQQSRENDAVQYRNQKNLDINAYLKNRESQRRTASSENLSLQPVFSEADLDIPTFLRRKLEVR